MDIAGQPLFAASHSLSSASPDRYIVGALGTPSTYVGFSARAGLAAPATATAIISKSNRLIGGDPYFTRIIKHRA